MKICVYAISKNEEQFVKSTIEKLKKKGVSASAKLHKGVLKHMKQELGHKIIEEEVLLLKQENFLLNSNQNSKMIFTKNQNNLEIILRRTKIYTSIIVGKY